MRSKTLFLLMAILIYMTDFAAAQETPKVELFLHTGHTDEITGVAVADDGKHVVTASKDGTAVLWDAANGKKVQFFLGHGSALFDVAMTADGRQVVTAAEDRTVIVWDALSGKRLQTFASSAAISRDGKHVVTAGDEGKSASLWEAASGKKLQTFTATGAQITFMGPGAAGKGTVTWKGTLNQLAVKRVDVTSDGKTAVLVCGTTTFLMDAATGKSLNGFGGKVASAALSENGKHVALLSDFVAQVWLYEIADPKKLQTFRHAGLTSMALSRDGKLLLTGSKDASAILWDAAKGDAKKLYSFQGHAQAVTTVALSGNGKFAVTGSQDRSAILWDATTRKRIRVFLSHAAPVTHMALSGDGKRLVACADYRATLWGPADGKILQRYQVGAITCVAISRDGRHIVAGTADQSAQRWADDSDKRLSVYEGHPGPVICVALSGDGRILVTGSDDKAILWDAAKGEKLRSIESLRGAAPLSSRIAGVALSSDGKQLITTMALDLEVVMWDTANGSKIRTFTVGATAKRGPASPNYQNSVAISDDGKVIVAGLPQLFAGGKPRPTLWHAHAEKPIDKFLPPINLFKDPLAMKAYPESRSRITSVALSGDGKLVVFGSREKIARLTDMPKQAELQTFHGHGNLVTSVAISSDGKHVWTASEDGTTRLWDPATGKERCRLYTFDAGKDWLVVTPDGRFDGSAGAWRFVAYREPGTLKLIDDDATRKRFHRPGLLAEVWHGK